MKIPSLIKKVRNCVWVHLIDVQVVGSFVCIFYFIIAMKGASVYVYGHMKEIYV
jgi:hypothetical protein